MHGTVSRVGGTGRLAFIAALVALLAVPLAAAAAQPERGLPWPLDDRIDLRPREVCITANTRPLAIAYDSGCMVEWGGNLVEQALDRLLRGRG